MKRSLLATTTVILFQTICFSQDNISTKSRQQTRDIGLTGCIAEVKNNFLGNNTETIENTTSKHFILAGNEKKSQDSVKKEQSIQPDSILKSNSTDLFLKGKFDAIRYYRGYKGASALTLIATLLSPLGGLIPATICSSTKPKDNKLNYPNPELMKQSDYYIGYTKKAKKIKQGKVWTNWGIGFGVNLVFALFLITKQ